MRALTHGSVWLIERSAPQAELLDMGHTLIMPLDHVTNHQSHPVATAYGNQMITADDHGLGQAGSPWMCLVKHIGS
jgi:hypothetical protein